MRILRNTSLKPYNTFGVDYIAATIIHIRTEKEAKQILRKDIDLRKPILIIGSGSNLLFMNDFTGTIVCPDIKRIRIEGREGNNVIVSAGAGVKWDRLVEWSVGMGFSGIENLSGIPGNVGAVPVQNIGAYGREAKDVITKVRTIDTKTTKTRVFANEECRFAYRNSLFKSSVKGRYLITRVWFRLNRDTEPDLSYGSLKKEVSKIGKPTLENIRLAVLKTRVSKLPDPEIIGNAGSFFKNPLVDSGIAEKLLARYPTMPVYDDPSGRKKLSAGWLIEQCGWKGKSEGNAGVHERQALVIVNYGKATGKDIYDLSERIRVSVNKKFRIGLEREVEIVS